MVADKAETPFTRIATRFARVFELSVRRIRYFHVGSRHACVVPPRNDNEPGDNPPSGPGTDACRSGYGVKPD
jgi:hypothetical protein